MEHSPEIIITGLILVGFSMLLLGIARTKRLRVLKRLLYMTGTQLVVQVPSLRKLFPNQIDLVPDEILVDTLYRTFAVVPQVFAPEKIRQVLVEPRAIEEPLPEGALTAPTEEEKINRLVGLRHFEFEPGQIPVDAVTSNLLKNLMSVLKGKKN